MAVIRLMKMLQMLGIGKTPEINKTFMAELSG